MPIQHRARYRVLTSLLDTSFGKSSERAYPNHFIKMTMPLENTVQIKSQILINIGGSINIYNELRPKYREELLDLISKRLERIADEYKKALEGKEDLISYREQPYEEAPEKTVKLTVDPHSLQEWLEDISVSAYRTNKTCIYHLNCTATVT